MTTYTAFTAHLMARPTRCGQPYSGLRHGRIATVMTAILLLLGGCSVGPNDTPTLDNELDEGALTEAVHANHLQRNPGQPYRNLAIIAVQPWDTGHIAVFSATQPQRDGTASPVVGYAVVHTSNGVWTIETTGSVGGYPPPTLVMYGSDTVANTSIVFGRILSPEITAVEATFDAEQSVRGAVSDQGFVLIGAGAQQLRSLRVLDSDGQTLRMFQRDDVSNLSEERQ